MITHQKLDELDALAVAARQEPGWFQEEAYYQDIDALTGSIPELTAEIRRLWAELRRGNQVGMIGLLRETREAPCTS